MSKEKGKSIKDIIGGLFGILILASVIAYCSSDTDSKSSDATTTSAASPTTEVDPEALQAVVSGPALVIDGDSILVAGTALPINNKTEWALINAGANTDRIWHIKLRHIDAPEFEQLCTEDPRLYQKDPPWYTCGISSWYSLRGMIERPEPGGLISGENRYGISYENWAKKVFENNETNLPKALCHLNFAVHNDEGTDEVVGSCSAMNKSGKSGENLSHWQVRQGQALLIHNERGTDAKENFGRLVQMKEEESYAIKHNFGIHGKIMMRPSQWRKGARFPRNQEFENIISDKYKTIQREYKQARENMEPVTIY